MISCIYFLRYNDWLQGKWKIGKTSNLKLRLKQYIKPVEKVHLTFQEHQFHLQFESTKIYNSVEFFIISDEQM